MKKAYINSNDHKTYTSEYQVEIKYADGKILKEQIMAYSYSDLFERIKEKHEDEHDQKVTSIKIDLVR